MAVYIAAADSIGEKIIVKYLFFRPGTFCRSHWILARVYCYTGELSCALVCLNLKLFELTV